MVVHELLETVFQWLYPPYQGLLLALKGDGRDWPAIEADHGLHAAVDFFHRMHHTEELIAGIAVVVAVGLAVVAWKRGPKLEE